MALHFLASKALKRLYEKALRTYPGFRIAVFLSERGVGRRVAFFVNHRGKVPRTTAKMRTAQEFVKANEERIENMLSLLADRQSVDSWHAAMAYRTERTPIPGNLCLLGCQYFVPGLVPLSGEIVFVDGGAFIGDTVQHLFNAVKKQGGSVKRVVSFEPDSRNIEVLRRHFRNKPVMTIEKGLYDKEGTLSFVSNGATSKIEEARTVHTVQRSSENVASIAVTRIDDVPECRDATFIKMDIEGSELNALEGARETILRNRPILAICIYHSNEHMVAIAEWIHDVVPDYSLHVRQHALSDRETVLYGIPHSLSAS